MRVRFHKGKQRELLHSFKTHNGFTWPQVAASLGVKYGALHEWINEKVLLPQHIYDKLDPDRKYQEHVIEMLSDNWGLSKGGMLSPGSTKSITIPEHSEELAELCGIILGDGNMNQFIDGKKRRSYDIRIAGHAELDHTYLESHVAGLFRRLFGVNHLISKRHSSNAMYLVINSRKVLRFLYGLGLSIGRKKYDNPRIPEWIRQNPQFLASCIRGLFDTDGSIHRMSGRDANLLRITFTSYYPSLMTDVREGLQSLGYHPSQVIVGKQIFLSRQSEIVRYLKEVGFANDKHRRRVVRLCSPVV
jgi:intein/homing endonuclease